MQLRDKTINLPKNEKALKIKSEIKASRKGLKGREIIFTLHALVQRGNWGLEGFLVGEGTISYATWWEQSKDIKLPGEPRFVLPYNLFVHIVHFIQANSTILRQNVSWGHWVGSKLHREGCQKWGARRGSEEIRWYRDDDWEPRFGNFQREYCIFPINFLTATVSTCQSIVILYILPSTL